MVLHHRPQEEDGGQEGPQWNGQYKNLVLNMYMYLDMYIMYIHVV